MRSLARGLELLRVMNRHDKGRASLAQIAAETRLHRTTVRRLLETLIEEGYVKRSESDGRYVLTLNVRALSEGFKDEEQISAVSGPILAQLLQQVRWPSDLCTPDGGSMLIRESTHRFSSLSFNRAMVGERLPMLLTAAGRAYFCYCADEEREALLVLLRRDPVQAALANDTKFIANLIAHTRSRGYSLNEGDWSAERKIGAIAVPVFQGGKVIASINVIYLVRAASHAEAATRYLPALVEAARRLEATLASGE